MLRVMEIEKFAVHDGPGIRTVVFLQGCPLFCPWCANPESQVIKKQLMYSENKCTRCQTCLKHCPQKNIKFLNNRMVFDRRTCGECEICGEVCPNKAISFSGRIMSIDNILAEVLKDKDYYDDSNGGITISGGEPFVQYEGFLKLIKECKKKNIHVCVETAGNVSLQKIAEAEPYIDLFLFDIKHVDKEKLLNVVGADFNKVIANLKYITDVNPQKVIIRVPVIPSFNYDKKTIEDIINLACSYKIHELHLLPFHILGKNKYKQMDKKYLLDNLTMLNKRDMEKFLILGEEKKINIKIGG